MPKALKQKQEYGIPLSRYTVFLQNCPLGHDPNALGFLQRNLFAAEGTLRIIKERNEFTSFDISTIFYIITAEETEK